MSQIRIGDIPLGRGAPLVLIAGLNVIESESAALACAHSRCSDLAGHVGSLLPTVSGWGTL